MHQLQKHPNQILRTSTRPCKKRLTQHLPRISILLIGDFNAKVGCSIEPSITGSFGLGEWNDTGDRLVEFCAENELTITNTLFKQPNRRLYTWTSPDGNSRNQIDYIICQRRWKSSVLSVKTRPGADCGTDHERLEAKLSVRFQKFKRQI